MFNKQHPHRDGCLKATEYTHALHSQTVRLSIAALDWPGSDRNTSTSSAKPAAGALRDITAGVTWVQRRLLLK